VIKRIAAALLVIAVAQPLAADFRSVARAIESKKGVKRVWIPFLGVARALIWVARPEGVRDFQLATFEGTGNVDPQVMHDVMRTKVGKGFTPLVQVWSKKSNEFSFIYARPGAGDQIELMILVQDASDTVLVRVEVDGSVVARELADQPRHVSRVARR
jgi:hypothetical protein